jgi:hypothetical protein
LRAPFLCAQALRVEPFKNSLKQIDYLSSCGYISTVAADRRTAEPGESTHTDRPDRLVRNSKYRGRMAAEIKIDSQAGVDKGLVAMFLKMSPEERLRANDNALSTILELRHACRERKTCKRRSECNS